VQKREKRGRSRWNTHALKKVKIDAMTSKGRSHARRNTLASCRCELSAHKSSGGGTHVLLTFEKEADIDEECERGECQK
jgi:CDGSH-type Zn-finger protein